MRAITPTERGLELLASDLGASVEDTLQVLSLERGLLADNGLAVPNKEIDDE